MDLNCSLIYRKQVMCVSSHYVSCTAPHTWLYTISLPLAQQTSSTANQDCDLNVHFIRNCAGGLIKTCKLFPRRYMWLIECTYACIQNAEWKMRPGAVSQCKDHHINYWIHLQGWEGAGAGGVSCLLRVCKGIGHAVSDWVTRAVSAVRICE